MLPYACDLHGLQTCCTLTLTIHTQVQAPIRTYRAHAYCLAFLSCMLQVVAFVVMDNYLHVLAAMIASMAEIGDAGVLATRLSMYSGLLAMLYTNQTDPHLRWLSGPSDVPYLKQV
jgi:hypothetical protein